MPNKTASPRRRPSRQQLRDLDLEITFLEGIVRRDSEYIEALQILGDDYTRRGRFCEGLKIDERLARLRPDDSVAHYNLACSYALTDQYDLAAEALDMAIDLGYRDFKWMTQDPDLKKLRDQAEYKRIRAKLRQLKAKVR